MKLRSAPSKRVVLLGMVLTSIALMAMPVGVGGWLRAVARPVLVPGSHLGMTLTMHFRSRVEELFRPPTARELAELEALRGQLLAMHQIILGQQSKLDELRQWRDAMAGFRCQIIDAQVVAGQSLPMRDGRVVTYRRGQPVGEGNLATTRLVMHDKPVSLPEKLTALGSNYVVGRIVEPSAFSATLQMVTDPEFRMSARLWRMIKPGQQRRIFVGGPGGGWQQRVFKHDGPSPVAQPIGDPVAVEVQGDGARIVLRHVPDQACVEPGDLVATSPTDALLPFGLTIGRVTGSERETDDAHFLTVYVEPLADLATVRDVYIVLPLSAEAP